MYTLLTLLFLRKRILGIRYKHQVIRIMRLQAVWILLSYQFTRVNELWNTACRTPLPKINWLRHGVDIVMSDLQYIIVLREAYKVQTRKYYIQHGVNRYMPSVRYYFYVNWRTQFKCKNVFFGMVIQFKKSTTSPLRENFIFYWTLELFHQKSSNGRCFSSRYIYNLNKCWI